MQVTHKLQPIFQKVKVKYIMHWEDIVKKDVRERTQNPDYQRIQEYVENMEKNIRPFTENKFWKKMQQEFIEKYKEMYDDIRNTENKQEAMKLYNDMVKMLHTLQNYQLR